MTFDTDLPENPTVNFDETWVKGSGDQGFSNNMIVLGPSKHYFCAVSLDYCVLESRNTIQSRYEPVIFKLE